MTCPNLVSYGAVWAIVVLAFAALAYFIGIWRVARGQALWGQDEIILVCPPPWGLDASRLRFRRRSVGATNTEQFGLDFDQTDPGLADLVRETAKRLARERGAITSADIWTDLEANNPTSYARLKLRPKGINVAWTPRRCWQTTGEWRPLGSNKRNLPCWQLREEVAA